MNDILRARDLEPSASRYPLIKLPLAFSNSLLFMGLTEVARSLTIVEAASNAAQASTLRYNPNERSPCSLEFLKVHPYAKPLPRMSTQKGPSNALRYSIATSKAGKSGWSKLRPGARGKPRSGGLTEIQKREGTSALHECVVNGAQPQNDGFTRWVASRLTQ